MTTHFREIAERAAADGQIAPGELAELRSYLWGDGIVSKPEAEALFEANRALAERTPEWCDVFVEAIGEFVLNGTPPRLQCTDDEAAWLIAQIDRGGTIESMVELECLVRILERAENAPDRLKNYVLAQIERAVLTGTGPTRCGGVLSAATITAAECRIIRRVIFAGGGDGPAAVSRFEAEMLFRLKDTTQGQENSPEWDELFIDGVANFLKGFAFHNAQLSPERKRELEAFMTSDSQPNLSRFMGRMVREVPQVANHFGKVFGRKAPARPGYAELAAEGEQITEYESAWLDAMIDTDGEVDALESRLLARLAAED